MCMVMVVGPFAPLRGSLSPQTSHGNMSKRQRHWFSFVAVKGVPWLQVAPTRRNLQRLSCHVLTQPRRFGFDFAAFRPAIRRPEQRRSKRKFSPAFRGGTCATEMRFGELIVEAIDEYRKQEDCSLRANTAMSPRSYKDIWRQQGAWRCGKRAT